MTKARIQEYGIESPPNIHYKSNGAESSAPLLCSAEGGDRGTKRGP